MARFTRLALLTALLFPVLVGCQRHTWVGDRDWSATVNGSPGWWNVTSPNTGLVQRKQESSRGMFVARNQSRFRDLLDGLSNTVSVAGEYSPRPRHSSFSHQGFRACRQSGFLPTLRNRPNWWTLRSCESVKNS